MAREKSDNDLDRIEHMVAMSRTAQRLMVGEAAWRTSAAFQAAHPSLPWKQIAGFRHRAVHDYFDIDNRVVWLIATT